MIEEKFISESIFHYQLSSENKDMYLQLEINPKCSVFLVKMCQKDNRFGLPMVKAFNACLDRIESLFSQFDVRHCILMTIGNNRFYSNGLDIQAFFPTSDPSKADSHVRNKALAVLGTFLDEDFLPLLGRMLVFPIPTVALINGHAFAGGFLLALAHDYRIMQSEQGFICMNEIEIGLPMHPSMMALLHAKIKSDTLVRDCLLEAKRWNGSSALSDSLVDAITSSVATLSSDGLTFVQQKSKSGRGGEIYGKLKKAMYYHAWKMLISRGSWQKSTL